VTPEERERIYREEKIREQARLDASREFANAEKKRRDQIRGIGCLVMLAILVAFAFSLSYTGGNGDRHQLDSPEISADSLGSPDTVESAEANAFLREQAQRRKELLKSLEATRGAGDLRAGLNALKRRRAELVRALNDIQNGGYSARDRIAMRKPVTEELVWVTNSIIGLESIQ